MIGPALLAGLVFVAAPAAGAMASSAPLADPVSLNIGLSCQWQQRCINQQQKAMKRALHFVKKKQPPSWRIQMCNRNASRKRNRMDWIGFHNCVRNAELRPPPPRSTRKPARRAAPAASSRRSLGERG